MTTTAIRKLLIDYVQGADDKKVKAIYTLLEKDIEETSFKLTDEQLSILDREYELYLSGDRNHTREEAFDIIRNKK